MTPFTSLSRTGKMIRSDHGLTKGKMYQIAFYREVAGGLAEDVIYPNFSKVMLSGITNLI